jgi:hypothetical protein
MGDGGTIEEFSGRPIAAIFADYERLEIILNESLNKVREFFVVLTATWIDFQVGRDVYYSELDHGDYVPDNPRMKQFARKRTPMTAAIWGNVKSIPGLAR